MKRTLTAAAVFLFLFCFVSGCRNGDAAQTAESQTAAAETASFAEPETTAPATEKPQTTAAPTTMKPKTTTAAATATTAKQKTTTAATTATTAKPKTTTAATTATTAQPKTTRKTLIDKWRDRLSQPVTSKPDPAFFDDAVFVGDSVTLGLRNYATSQRNKGKTCLGRAQFLCAGSMGYTNALNSVSAQSVHPTYKGNKVSVENGVQLCGAKKVFIMLGMNDFAAYSESQWKQNVNSLLDRILEKNPNVSIYLESVTPILNGMEHGRLNNTNIQKFNAYLQQVCDERGFTYVDIYHVLADESGHLKNSYCGDPGAMGIHMSADGCAAWSRYLQSAFCGE